MPELPDLEIYRTALERRILGRALERVRIENAFLLRSVSPPLSAVERRTVSSLRRLGKRLVLGLEEDLFLVLHLMLAGRLHWRATGVAIPKRSGLAAFDFAPGTLILTEAGSRRRASLYVVAGEHALARHDPGGLEVLECDLARFRERLIAERHTLKRALTDPRVLAGIGNAYSDEILHHARLSPFRRTTALDEEEIVRLFTSTRQVLEEWTARLAGEVGARFPERVTAFRPDMAVHGRYGQPCPVCAAPVQRIVYAENESNYCPGCQTGGKIFADRMLSRLLKDDWPKRLVDLET